MVIRQFFWSMVEGIALTTAFVLGCVLACLLALILLVRAPFQAISWALGLLAESIAALTAWSERVVRGL